MRLIVFDLETTGVDVTKDRIVELGYVLHDTERGELDARAAKIDPGIPIPNGASRVHGILDEHVRGRPRFDVAGPRFLARVRSVLHEAAGAGALVAYNGSRYDVPLFNAEMKRAGFDDGIDVDVIDPLVWLRKNMPNMRSRKLVNAYVEVCQKPEPVDAHSVLADCRMTAAITTKLLALDIIPTDSAERTGAQRKASDDREADFGRYGHWLTVDKGDGQVRIACGKHSGKALAMVDTSYLEWVLGNVDSLTPDARAVIEMRVKGGGDGSTRLV